MSADISADSLQTEMPGQHTALHPSVLFRLVGTQHEGQLLRIRQKKFTVGSSLGCTLALRSPHVHPLHGMFLRSERGLLFRAMASDTRVNGEAISDCWLSPGDRLSMGSIDLEVLENGTLDDEADPRVHQIQQTTQAKQTEDSPANSDTPYEIRLHEHQRVRKLLAEIRSSREQLHQALQWEELSAGETRVAPHTEAMKVEVDFDPITESQPCAEPVCSQNNNQRVDSEAFQEACEILQEDRPIAKADRQELDARDELKFNGHPAAPIEIEPTPCRNSYPTDAPSDLSWTLAPNSGFSADASAASPEESNARCDNAVEPRAYPMDSYLNERVTQRSAEEANLEAESMEAANSEDNATVAAKTEALLKSAFEDQLDSFADESPNDSLPPFDTLATSQDLSSLREVANLSAFESTKERSGKQASMLALIAAGGSSSAIGATLGLTSTSLLGSVVFVGLGVAFLAAAVATQASRMLRTA